MLGDPQYNLILCQAKKDLRDLLRCSVQFGLVNQCKSCWNTICEQKHTILVVWAISVHNS